MKIQINITKEILERSMMCGTNSKLKFNSENCAIALAVRDLFPYALVGSTNILIKRKRINLPESARNFIPIFDSLKFTPKKRLELEPFSFEIEIDEDLLDISIEEAHEVLRNSTSLELVE